MYGNYFRPCRHSTMNKDRTVRLAPNTFATARLTRVNKGWSGLLRFLRCWMISFPAQDASKRRGPSWSCCRRAILFLSTAHDDPERVIRQRPLQRLGLIPRPAHPDITFFIGLSESPASPSDGSARPPRSAMSSALRPWHRLRLSDPSLKATEARRPEPAGGLSSLGGSDELLKRIVDGGVFVVEVGADAVHDRNDGQRNAGSDEAVFNGGGTSLILHETRKKLGHSKTPDDARRPVS